ncbi:unnamed protein product [Closterium sp. Yama58-4]|nr:unnamed protein product [Closterium sp. Yama58-4]
MAASHHTSLVATASKIASPRLPYSSAVSRLSAALASSSPLAAPICVPLRLPSPHGTATAVAATAAIPSSRRIASPSAKAARGPLRCARRRLTVSVRSAEGDSARDLSISGESQPAERSPVEVSAAEAQSAEFPTGKAVARAEAEVAIVASADSVGGGSIAGNEAAAEKGNWSTSWEPKAALGVLLLSVPVVPALPRCQWSAPLYFGLLALWAVYVGSHRSLTRPPVQAVSMQQGMAVPILCSLALFSLYCLLRFAPDLDLRLLFSSYLTLVGGVAVASHLADPLKAALPKEINDRLSLTLDIPSWLLESSPSSSSSSSSSPSSSPSPTPSSSSSPPAPAVLTLSASDVLSAALGMAMAVASMQPSAPFSLGNIVAVCIVSEVLQMLSLRSFAVASAVLVGLLLYDVFWVFGSSPIFGDNVMVTVATADALVGPMKLVFPRWTVDASSPYSILGLGDVAAPGLLMALMLRFDSHRSSSSAAAATSAAAEPASADAHSRDPAAQADSSSTSSSSHSSSSSKGTAVVVAAAPDGAGLEDKTYFLVSVASYLAGLAITIGVNTVTGAAQPALLYLVPSLLLGVSAAAAARSELDVLLRFDDTASGDGMEGGRTGLLFKPPSTLAGLNFSSRKGLQPAMPTVSHSASPRRVAFPIPPPFLPLLVLFLVLAGPPRYTTVTATEAGMDAAAVAVAATRAPPVAAPSQTSDRQEARVALLGKEVPFTAPPAPPPAPAATTPSNTTLVLLPDNPYAAKCLDGSPPGYYFRAGVGEGRRKWHVFLAGGGWCATRAECVARSKTYLGSSRMYPADPSAYADAPWMKPGYDAILSANASANPAVHEWNLVRVLYCDGGGYAGTKGRTKLPDGTSIYLDGWNVFRAVVQDLRGNRGMESPSDILLSGSSAGGQAVVNLCDWLAASFPNATTRCLVDSGFFMDAKDRLGKHGFRSLAQSITALHRPYNPNCTLAAKSAQQWKCFFPQYTLRTVATPVFIFHTLFDYIAAMLGNQLPKDNTSYAANCVREVINTAPTASFQFIKLKRVSLAAEKPPAVNVTCTAGERDAVMGVALAVHNQIVAIASDRPSIGAYVPTSSVHTAITNRFWTVPWINGTSVCGAFKSWSRGSPQGVAMLIHS